MSLITGLDGWDCAVELWPTFWGLEGGLVGKGCTYGLQTSPPMLSEDFAASAVPFA
jgi:hypothetical protein